MQKIISGGLIELMSIPNSANAYDVKLCGEFIGSISFNPKKCRIKIIVPLSGNNFSILNDLLPSINGILRQH